MPAANLRVLRVGDWYRSIAKGPRLGSQMSGDVREGGQYLQVPKVMATYHRSAQGVGPDR